MSDGFDHMGGFAGDEFDSFDVDEFTSAHDDDAPILGLVDDADLKFVGNKGAALISDATDLDEDTDVSIHATNIGDDAVTKMITKVVVPVDAVVYKSKMEHARAIYAREALKGPIVRKNIIPLFIAEANCTTAGAATYYATIHVKQMIIYLVIGSMFIGLVYAVYSVTNSYTKQREPIQYKDEFGYYYGRKY